jgi:hypothetical protein
VTAFTDARRDLLADLRIQLPKLADRRARERTKRVIRQLEIEIAGGRGIAGKAATK